MPQRSLVRTYLTRFAVLSVLALLVLSAVTLFASRQIAEREALREAEVRAVAIADDIASPLVSDEVRAGDPGATEAMDQVLSGLLGGRVLRHIKVWDRSGRVIWSDEDPLVGRTFRLPPRVRVLFGTRATAVEVSDLHGGENEFEHAEAPLMEVYVGSNDADGVPFVLETYTSSERIDAARSSVLRQLLPLTLGVLLVFELAVLALAYSLAGWAERVSAHRSEILDRSMSSWHVERRRLAHDLHDGVVQDLAAMSYALPSVVERLPRDDTGDEPRATLGRMEQILQDDLVALRAMVADLFPADLSGDGLARAVGDFVPRLRRHGIEVDARVPDDLDLSPEVGGLAYRVIREGLRNVERHARATRVGVEITSDADNLLIRVTDDGQGLGETGEAGPRVEQGHAGLRLLGELLGDIGGRLDVRDRAAGGAQLEAEIPLVLI
ncbi:sensor histidine kinase [Marmoricola sp. RAF53]|uniref:sensor histidine kinase n=1 Tax=Marmoricola sp. RAF53 TaxID=3233059 RepID=UPI003F971EE5